MTVDFTHDVLLVTGVVVLVATCVLFLRTRSTLVLGMLIGALMVGASEVMTHWGPFVTEPLVPTGFAPIQPDGTFGSVTRPLAIVAPLFIFGLLIFGGCFFAFCAKAPRSASNAARGNA